MVSLVGRRQNKGVRGIGGENTRGEDCWETREWNPILGICLERGLHMLSETAMGMMGRGIGWVQLWCIERNVGGSVDSLDDGAAMFEIEIELDIIFGEDFGDWGKGGWEKNKIRSLDIHL
jgi:hypothetical protein